VPRPYWFQVPVLNKRTGLQDNANLPCILPHELFARIVESNPEQVPRLLAGPDNGNHLLPFVQEWSRAFDVPVDQVVPVGLHGDGVPFAAKMRDSLEQLVWNFCTQPHSERFLFTALPRSCLAGKPSWDAMLSVFVWSMKCLALGSYPRRRHDGTPWQDTDRSRASLAGERLPLRACLVQARGDWEFYKSVLGFPSWAAQSICWRCRATRREGEYPFTDCSLAARWRQARMTGPELLATQRAGGQRPSALFSTPGFQVKHVQPDWLHTVDLGVGQDAIGNLFAEAVDLLPGRTVHDRVQVLWNRVQAYYAREKVQARLDNLTLEMIRPPGKGPKLRSKAAECRHLYPFGAALAQELGEGSEHRRTVAALMQYLLEASRLIRAVPYDAARAAAVARKFALLFSCLEREALQRGDTQSWRCKPKLHLFLELMEFAGPDSGAPSLYWTYRDEDYGGKLALSAARRGGAKSATNTIANLVARYRARRVTLQLDFGRAAA